MTSAEGPATEGSTTERSSPGKSRQKVVGAIVVAGAAYILGILSLPQDLSGYVLLASWIVAGAIIGSPETLASEAFVDALAPAWIGFSAGAFAAILTGLASLGAGLNTGENLPLLLLSWSPFVYAGIPVGFLVGLVAALTAGIRSWILDRRGAKRRRSGQSRAVDDPEDPFGWKSRQARK